MKKHKHDWEKIDDLLICKICNKAVKTRKPPPTKNGCFGTSGINIMVKCFICGNAHKFNTKKFPIAVKERIRDKKGKATGDIIKGYLCIKCSRKEAKHMNLGRDKKLMKPTVATQPQVVRTGS